MSDDDAPKFSLCQLCVPRTSFEDDVELCRDLDIRWLGVDERKISELGPAGARQMLEEAGIRPGICTPATLSILPSDIIQGRHTEPERRVEDIISGIGVLAQLDPVAVMVVTGPAGSFGDAARGIVVDGLRELADAAAGHGLPLAIEPMRPEHAPVWSIISGLVQGLELVDEVGRDIRIVYDVWHLWRDADIVALTEEHADRIINVQLSDYRDPTRVPTDRVLPGDGIIDLPALFGALDRGGFDGVFDLEVFSDPSLPDSVWKRPPAEWVADGRRGFLEAWAARR